MSVTNRDNSKSANSVAMDSRKFLSLINNSAQSRITFFEHAVDKLGKKREKDWQLAALLTDKLVIEDTTSGEFLIAEHSRQKGGKVVINNIKPVDIHEGKKSEIFESSCRELIDAIESEDTKKINSAFGKVAASRFRSTVIPESGYVRTKDGVVRKVAITEGRDTKSDLGTRILNVLTDQVTIDESGNVTGAFADGIDLKLPSTKLIGRKLVALNMREAAANAYWSNNFQTLTESTAGHICNGQLEEAVRTVAGFLHENQEFNLLTRGQLRTVISNSLAARGVFSEALVEDTTSLFYKTGLKVNKKDIVEAWGRTALQTEDPVILESAKTLEIDEDFENAYEKFLYTFFEATSNTTSQVLSMALKHIKDVVGDSEDVDAAEIDELITSLENGGDKEAEIRAMEVVKTVSDGMDVLSNKGLDDFDTIPGSEVTADSKPVDEPVDESNDTTVDTTSDGSNVTNITINTGANGANGGNKSDDGLDLGDLDLGDIPVEDDEFADGDLDDADESEEDADVRLEEDKIAEQAVKEMIEEESDDKSDDFYSIPEDLDIPKINHDYKSDEDNDDDIDERDDSVNGNDEGDDEEIDECDDSVNEDVDVEAIRSQMADMNVDDDDAEGIYHAAQAYVSGKYSNLSDNDRDDKAKDLAGKLAARSTVDENQQKTPTKQLSRRGLKRSAINKLVTEGKLQFIKGDDDIAGRFKDIEFKVLPEEMALVSADGKVQVSIPEELAPAAKYITEMSDDEVDTDDFVEWLNENIAQLEVISEEQDNALEEAIARVTASSMGDIDIEVDTDGDEPVEPVVPAPVTPDPLLPDPSVDGESPAEFDAGEFSGDSVIGDGGEDDVDDPGTEEDDVDDPDAADGGDEAGEDDED